MRHSRARLLPLACLFAPALLPGCAYHVDWPDTPARIEHNGGAEVARVYRVAGAEKCDYWQWLREGRVHALSFDDNGDGRPDQMVDFAYARSAGPHFVIILDGVPFETVRKLHEEGRFRLFGPPTRVITVFPAMTDVALSRMLGTGPCPGIEAMFFDYSRNALSHGNKSYLKGENAPWTAAVDYAVPQGEAINAYLRPAALFSRELRDMEQHFRQAAEGTQVAYCLATAGLGTRGGESAVRDYLLEIEKLVERITYERRGRVRFSLTADHGHGLTPVQRVSFRRTLAAAGFRPAKRLGGPKDVVEVEYGLVTCACFHTRRPREVADALRDDPAVELAAFLEGGAVIVQDARAEARITRAEGGYRYHASGGDPLGLEEVIEGLRQGGEVSTEGVINDRALMEATATHRYPDPLHRLWDCFHALVKHPPDVIVSLRPDRCHGSKFFHFFVAPVASTHGSLDAGSSITFLLTNAVDNLPPVLRVEDVWATIHANAETPMRQHAETPKRRWGATLSN